MVGCFKFEAILGYIHSDFQISLSYRLRLSQNTCVCLLYGHQHSDFFVFHSPTGDCLDSFQVMLSLYLIDSHIGM